MQILLDSNIVIYGMRHDDTTVSAFIQSYELYISPVTMIEALGFTQLSSAQEDALRQFLKTCTVLYPNEAIIETAIQLRQRRKMSLGDAIIAATAIRYALPVCTRNVKDFSWIAGLNLLNPYHD